MHDYELFFPSIKQYYCFFHQKTGATGSVNNNVLFNVSIPNSPANGFAALGTESYGIADFDNFLITSQEEGLRRMQVPAQTGTRKGSSLYFSPEIKKHH